MQKRYGRAVKRGFTIVELMVVVAVIGILAGISVGAYDQWRKTTARREVQSDLHAVASAMESKRNFDNVYPSGATALSQIAFTSSAGVALTYQSGTALTYCIEARSTKESSIVYHLDAANKNKTPEVGTC
ncbi:MAG: prepilin-type N-terminal cleavage/methylation domain-containing protein [Candidatus Saccharimonadales bacterium]